MKIAIHSCKTGLTVRDATVSEEAELLAFYLTCSQPVVRKKTIEERLSDLEAAAGLKPGEGA